jgi:hypothetical protein
MKIYVCYSWVPDEGCTDPLVAFISEKDAQEWCQESHWKSVHEYSTFEFVELELE